ncbi:dienelactone hydrolase family protein [Nitzschia inconspicua]|uniref:Dienelactone hydrolase family protein n=1 Tax=Nitzschia inconspicua TaxID=303405 RepID=A0A9K3M541_9STRA|nr:dienelactone hydrolase family protein [Nitzschia inconspicua]
MPSSSPAVMSSLHQPQPIHILGLYIQKRILILMIGIFFLFFPLVSSFMMLPKLTHPQHNIQCSSRIADFHKKSTTYVLKANGMEEDEGEDEDFGLPAPPMMDGDDDDDDILTDSFLQDLTIPQLKQQLRLRGLKVTGKKQDLIDRLLQKQNFVDRQQLEREVGPPGSSPPTSQQSPKDEPEFIDVTAYLDEEDRSKSVKSSIPSSKDDDENPPLSNTEVWGTDAKIVDDYEGRSPVVDGLSRTVIEFRGSNQTMVQAFVVASRDAMKPFLQGGRNRTIGNLDDPEATLREIQMKREMAEKRPVKFEDEIGEEEGDEPGYYKDALHRDYSDWGKYSVTGAQLSAQEVQGVLVLSDVYGPFTDATKMLAEKIAFECQPVVCMVPDLFRRNPWKEDPSTPGFNEMGQDYEEWRATHPDIRVSIDIRAAAAVLREQYGVSSVVVWGTCYGGGRALEAAAGYFPRGVVHDVNGATELLFTQEKNRNFAVMGVFAGMDKLSGATPDDAKELKKLLAEDERVKDYIIKVFPGQDHGFAHISLGRNHEQSDLDRFVDDEFGGAGRISLHDGDAEVACLLSTAFMETYSRKFLPTTGDPISRDEDASDWNEDLNMKDLSEYKYKDVRQEIEDSLTNFKEMPLGGRMIDPSNESEVLKALRAMEPENQPEQFRILDDDDLETAFAKLTAADENFQLF